MPYLQRTLEPVLLQAAAEFPAVVVGGPRQSGKTTLLRHLFGDRARYVSMEPPDTRELAESDPRGFLDLHRPPIIIDEVQYAPILLPYLKERIDADRGAKGQYLLTGSQNLLMMERVTESLAGRCAVLRLLPLSLHELSGRPQARPVWEREEALDRQTIAFRDLWAGFLRGGYPELAVEPERTHTLWFSSYLQTYLERDVRSLRQVEDLMQFQAFLRALAARSGQLLNLSDLSRDLGLSLNTAKQWLSVLEATFQVFILRPFYRNIGKRLVKTPKVYFTDVGLLCHLLRMSDPESAAVGPFAGAIAETAVLSELLKAAAHAGEESALSFWRTGHGAEVDFVIEQPGRLVPIEVKSTATPRPAMASGLKSFLQDYADETPRGWLVHLGEHALPLGPGVTAIPYAAL